MKIKILFIALILSTVIAFSQTSPADKLFEKYADKDGITTVSISKYMFSLFANKNTENNDNFQKVINGLESIRILTVDDSILNLTINFYKEIIDEFPKDKYKELMSVKGKNQDLKMLIRENNGTITEFLMIGGGKNNMLICITGKINLASLAELSKNMNIEGLDNLEKLNTSPKKK
jgi:hypothetical protein